MDNYLSGIKSIADYNADKSLIAELEAEIEQLKAEKVKLVTANETLKRKIGRSRHLKEWSHRSHKARYMIRELNGTIKPSILITRIARECYLSEDYIQKLMYPR